MIAILFTRFFGVLPIVYGTVRDKKKLSQHEEIIF